MLKRINRGYLCHEHRFLVLGYCMRCCVGCARDHHVWVGRAFYSSGIPTGRSWKLPMMSPSNRAALEDLGGDAVHRRFEIDDAIEASLGALAPLSPQIRMMRELSVTPI